MKELFIFLAVLGFTLLLSVEQPLAQNNTNVNSEPSQLKQKIKTKYKAKRVRISDDKKGLFYISGELTPQKYKKDDQVKAKDVKLTKEQRKQHSLDMGKAFLADEVDIFSSSSMDEEFKSGQVREDSHGNLHFAYKKKLNGIEVEGMSVLFHVNQDDEISGVNGELVPITEVMKTKAKEYITSSNKLSENEIRKIIEDDLLSSLGQNMKIDKDEMKLLITTEIPFVIWKADVILDKPIGRWLYRINAFNGELVSKKSGLQF